MWGGGFHITIHPHFLILPSQPLRSLFLIRCASHPLDQPDPLRSPPVILSFRSVASLPQDGCLLIWNVSLPLLHPSLFQHAEPTLRKVAAALDELKSPLNELKASLHLELARFEYSMDFIQKAYDHVSRGLALDIPSPPPGSAELPICRELRQLQARLGLQLDIYREAESVVEKATLVMEQAKAAKQPGLKQRLLLEAHKLLLVAEEEREREAEREGREGEGEKEGWRIGEEERRRERFVLWGELMRLGWQQRMSEMCEEAVSTLISVSWDPSLRSELVRVQAEAHFTSAELCIAKMQAIEASPGGE